MNKRRVFIQFPNAFQQAMKHIDPTTLYNAAELQDILRGVVKLETLRHHGLAGSPGSGYWGQNVVDSLNKYWDHLVRQRGTGKVHPKEEHLDEKPAFFENREYQVQNREVHPASGGNGKMESERQRFRRKVS